MSNSQKVKFPALKNIPGVWARNSRFAQVGDGVIMVTEHDQNCQHEEGEHGGSCRRHAVVVPGMGRPDYPFPSPDQLVTQAVAYFNALAREYQKAGRPLPFGQTDEDAAAAQSEFISFVRTVVGTKHPASLLARSYVKTAAKSKGGIDTGALAAMPKLPKVPVHSLIPMADGVTQSHTDVVVLRVGAGTLAEIMHLGRFKATIARQFDPFKGAVTWALNNMPEKFHTAAASLLDQLAKLEEVYSEALPRVIQFLSAQYPKASEEELLNAAVQVLNEQLAQILYVLSIWTDSFAQRRDGMYKQLEYVTFTVEQSLSLFRTGDVKGSCDEECQKKVKTHAFHVGDVFMARFSDQGPATIPGRSAGPIGAHAIEVPFDEKDVMVIYLPLYLHEFRHDYYHDVEGLEQSMLEVVVNAVQEDHKAGKYKLSSETLKLGKQEVRMIDMLTQICAQTLGETDADVAGGISLSGDAFAYSMLATFSAFNMRGASPFGVNRMLRSGSYYAIGEQGELAFEPHMPDYIRAYFVAAALDAVGLKESADEIRRLADGAAGLPLPKFVTWRNIDPQSKFKFDIKIPMSDLKQVAPSVVNAILHAKLPALGGVSTSQLVNWNPKRQEKVDALVALLMAGKSDIPWEMGDFWAPYVAGAAIKALWGLWKHGNVPPMHAAAMVEANARLMMDQVRVKHEEMQLTGVTPMPVAKPVPEPVAVAPATAKSAAPAKETDATGGGNGAK